MHNISRSHRQSSERPAELLDEAPVPARPLEVPDPGSGTPGSGTRRGLRGAAIAVAAAAVLVGGAAAAFADDGSTGTGSSTTSTDTAKSAAPSNGAQPPALGDPAAAPIPHLDGVVTSVSDSTILITDPDGFTRTIHLSSSTTYADGLTRPIATGKRIHAEGRVDTDGTSLAATSIALAPTPPAPPGDGNAPTPPAPPSGGNAPTPPAPPSGGNAPAPATNSNAPAPATNSSAPTTTTTS